MEGYNERAQNKKWWDTMRERAEDRDAVGYNARTKNVVTMKRASKQGRGGLQ